MQSPWEGVYYLLPAIHNGLPLHTKAWRFTGQGKRRFEPEPLAIIDQTG